MQTQKYFMIYAYQQPARDRFDERGLALELSVTEEVLGFRRGASGGSSVGSDRGLLIFKYHQCVDRAAPMYFRRNTARQGVGRLDEWNGNVRDELESGPVFAPKCKRGRSS